MLLVNTDFISGKELETIGLVSGAMIQSKHMGKDIGAAFKGVVGGELKAYSEMLNESREVAAQRMKDAAHAMGADAIINVRFTTSAVIQGAAEILAYGTAVKFK